MKAFPVVTEERGMVLVMVRGDHRVSEIKLGNALRGEWRPASVAEISERLGPPGFIGPVGVDVPVLLDEGVPDGPYVVGANRADHHLRGVEPGRDFAFERADVRVVEAGDLVGGHPITIEPAIEIGNIFKLGTRYSKALGATFLDESGAEQLIEMGCYGIGMARIAAAAVEQFADERGISWPAAIAPFAVHLVGLGKPGSEERELAERAYEALRGGGVDVIFDDRDAGAGEKFADAELLGAPLRLTVGRGAVESGEIEVMLRRGLEKRPGIAAAELVAGVEALCRELA
jgi:prolyl-tRNA synthetase